MTLTIEREQEFVNQFHYDARNYEWEKENGAPETNLNVQFQLVPADQLADGKVSEEDTAIHTILTFLIPLDDIVISGFVSQLNYIRGQVIQEQTEIDQEDMSQIASPLFEILKRMVYELTEVALDQPGINLEF
ncbi:DUF1149 family protein [Lactococcus nasutitermitis]|uniref:DUF1149 family protein n=1 Tax=Lactococcus nasutitermitis TaxID=1652957 RepID=A0ABV9JBS3_9LACT|nr:DUF1149 family protein [Lactococcus nasutitermitis]